MAAPQSTALSIQRAGQSGSERISLMSLATPVVVRCSTLCSKFTTPSDALVELRDGSGISWTICKSFAPRPRQITTPVPHHSAFIGQMPFLPPNQRHQSTEGTDQLCYTVIKVACKKVSSRVNKIMDSKFNIPDTYHQIEPPSSVTLSGIVKAVPHCYLHSS